MAHFSYVAQKDDGDVYKGVAEAADRFELFGIIRKEGARVVSVQEEVSNEWTSLSFWTAKFSKVKEYEKILFARNLSAMLSAGLSLARALSVIERQTKNAGLSRTVSQIAGDVRRGDTLHVALSKNPNVFSNLMVAMVRAGEEGGDLAQSLAVTSDQMERMYDLKKKIKGAMLYPCIILSAIVVIGVLMMVKVVPTLAATFKEMNADLPTSTKLVIGFSDFLITHTFSALVLAVVFVCAIIAMVRTERGRRIGDYISIHLPLIGQMVREVNAARTARTLASLSASGVDVITSLEITREVVQNYYFREIIAEAQKAVGQGEPLSVTFVRNDKLYPPFVGEMMSVGEETGNTGEMLKRLAVYYETEVDRKTKDMSTIIEPFLMLFIGGAVGFFAISMIAPIYGLSEHI